MIVVAVAVVMWESPQGFPRGVGRVESRLYGFPCFPYPGISMACFWRVASRDLQLQVLDRTSMTSLREIRLLAALALTCVILDRWKPSVLQLLLQRFSMQTISCSSGRRSSAKRCRLEDTIPVPLVTRDRGSMTSPRKLDVPAYDRSADRSPCDQLRSSTSTGTMSVRDFAARQRVSRYHDDRSTRSEV